SSRMRRIVLLAALVTPLGAPGAAASTPAPPVPGAELVTSVLARAAGELEQLVPHVLVDRVVSAELSLRDLAHRTEDQLIAWANEAKPPAPDLSMLTTSPVLEESSGFGWRDDPIRHTPRFHSGTDFRADPGTPVHVAGSGVVVFAGRQSGYGNIIYVDHGGGVVTCYAHLRKIEVAKHAKVSAGDRIGQVGSTGRATGPHLHFEVRLEGRPVDPVTAMSVAALERESPSAGRLAAYALAPELQAKARDGSDRHHGASRPERAGRAPRQQVLW
ncbi:MAG: M23 family metallopeptidase, partial [Acidobacteriota bacterium]